MDDSFKSRVEKIFGSLRSSQSSSLRQQQQRPPLWSLTDDEVERREWRRESAADREEKLCSSSFDEFLKEERRYRRGRLSRKELEDDLDDDDDRNGDSSQSGSRRIDGDGDEWEIRSFLGMDSTLDNEEEEDEYDKVAAGRENAGERLYMSDISDHGSYLNSQNVVYSSLNRTSDKDRRANHLAARIRLKEDDEEAQKLTSQNGYNADSRESKRQASNTGCQLRSILKRKDNSVGSKAQKRVRFDPACKHDLEESSEKFQDYSMCTSPMNSQDSDDGSLLSENARAVPDYVLNPSRYTRYSFDTSSEVNEESNAQACMDILKLVQKSKLEPGDAPLDLPKSVTFIPKRKSGNVQPGSSVSDIQEKEDESKKSLPPTSFPVAIAAAATQHSEVDGTEDCEPETTSDDNTAVIQKGSRSYRVKSQSDDF